MTANWRETAAPIELPSIGFGTWPLMGRAAESATRSALAAGYRLIDTAMNYDNEGMVGRAIRASGLDRDQIVVASKLPLKFHSRGGATDAVAESASRLGLDYIDLYLIHWPNPSKQGYRDAWRGLLDARAHGLARSVGVCNFTRRLLEEIAEDSGEMPAVNQIELNPYFPQSDLVAFHGANGIATEAWSPLGSGRDLLGEAIVQRVAAAHEISPAQAVLAWHRARGVVPLPRSGNAERQAENLAAASIRISPEAVRAFDGLAASATYQSLDPMTFVQVW